jgi:hypothetical protein
MADRRSPAARAALQAIAMTALAFALGAIALCLILARLSQPVPPAAIAAMIAAAAAVVLALASVTRRALSLHRGAAAASGPRTARWRIRTALVLVKLAMLLAVPVVGIVLAGLFLLGLDSRPVLNAVLLLLILNILLSLAGIVAGSMLQDPRRRL